MISLLSLFPDNADVTLQYIILWTFVLGASVVWVVVHLRRNARIRNTACDGQILRGRIRNILQYSREVLYGVNLETGRFDYLSPASFSLTGYAPEELQQLSLHEFLQHVHAEDREGLYKLIQQLENNDGPDWLGIVEYRFRHQDGQYRMFSDHLHVSYSPEGKAVELCGSIRDVTQIGRLEESMRILEKKFQDGQKMAGLGLLASGIAHDFNNLMTVILGNAELALMERGGSDDGVLDEIKRTTLRASELANQMLVYTGKTALSVGDIDLNAVVKEMGSLLDVSISKKVSIQYSLTDHIPMIRGDVSQIRQVVMNLITNASEAIGDQPGVIAISIHSVDLKDGELESSFPGSALPGGRYVRLEVSDTGAGMSRETMSKIFDPLFTTKVTGRGLGLAALLNAVERHNGAVTVSSDPGKGTVFRIFFPAEDADASGNAELQQRPKEDWRGWGTALVADDEDAVRDIVQALLERLGFRVLAASDGFETVETFTQHAEEITLLVMDINMPRLNGIEATQRIRHINPNLPVLFISGYARDQVMERFGQQMHTAFVKKPFQSGEFADGVRTIMEARR